MSRKELIVELCNYVIGSTTPYADADIDEIIGENIEIVIEVVDYLVDVLVDSYEKSAMMKDYASVKKIYDGVKRYLENKALYISDILEEVNDGTDDSKR